MSQKLRINFGLLQILGYAHRNMSRVIQVNFDRLTPEKLRSQTFWTYTVKLTDYHGALKKLIDHVNDPKYDVSIFILRGYLMIFSTKM